MNSNLKLVKITKAKFREVQGIIPIKTFSCFFPSAIIKAINKVQHKIKIKFKKKQIFKKIKTHNLQIKIQIQYNNNKHIYILNLLLSQIITQIYYKILLI